MNLDRRNYKEFMAIFKPAQVYSIEGDLLGYLWGVECGETYVIEKKTF